jgi:hypothetical protein
VLLLFWHGTCTRLGWAPSASPSTRHDCLQLQKQNDSMLSRPTRCPAILHRLFFPAAGLSEGSPVLVEVYDEDFASSDDFLGHVSHAWHCMLCSALRLCAACRTSDLQADEHVPMGSSSTWHAACTHAEHDA